MVLCEKWVEVTVCYITKIQRQVNETCYNCNFKSKHLIIIFGFYNNDNKKLKCFC